MWLFFNKVFYGDSTVAIVFLTFAKSGLFLFTFGLFQSIITIFHNIMWKNVYPVSGAGIQTHNLLEYKSSPITIIPGLPPNVVIVFDWLSKGIEFFSHLVVPGRGILVTCSLRYDRGRGFKCRLSCRIQRPCNSYCDIIDSCYFKSRGPGFKST